VCMYVCVLLCVNVLLCRQMSQHVREFLVWPLFVDVVVCVIALVVDGDIHNENDENRKHSIRATEILFITFQTMNWIIASISYLRCHLCFSLSTQRCICRSRSDLECIWMVLYFGVSSLCVIVLMVFHGQSRHEAFYIYNTMEAVMVFHFLVYILLTVMCMVYYIYMHYDRRLSSPVTVISIQPTSFIVVVNSPPPCSPPQ
jgi:hypothetical protein